MVNNLYKDISEFSFYSLISNEVLDFLFLL